MSEAVDLVAGDVSVATVRERTTRGSQVVTMLAVVVPPLGLVAAAIGLWGVALSFVDVAVFLALFALFEVAVRFDSAEADICQGLRTGRLDL